MRSGYFISPEFHRNLWVKLSPFRLAAAVIVFLVIGIVTSSMGGNSGAILRVSAIYLFILVVLIWGTYEAAFAMRDEIKGNTWDFQRISAISPAQLAFGKLFGATSYVWYCGVLIAGLYYCTFAYGEKAVYFAAFYMLMAGLLGHGVAFLISLASISSRRARGSRGAGGSGAAFVIGCAVALYVNEAFRQKAINAHVSAQSAARLFPDAGWYGLSLDGFFFAAAILVFFLFWVLLGCYRLARAELMHRVTPVVWTAFAVSLAAFLAGFAFDLTPPPRISEGLHVDGKFIFQPIPALTSPVIAAKWAFFIFAALAYLAMVFEAAHVRGYARLREAFRRGDIRAAMENLPRWLALAPFVVLSLGGIFAALALSAPDGEDYGAQLSAFVLSALLFMARDGFALHVIAMTKHTGAGFERVLYYTLAYFIVPMLVLIIVHGDRALDVFVNQILGAISAMMTEYAKFPHKEAVWLFLPTGTEPQVGILSGLIQALVAALVFFWLKTRHRMAASEAVQT